jgi:hypothetical protein
MFDIKPTELCDTCEFHFKCLSGTLDESPEHARKFAQCVIQELINRNRCACGESCVQFVTAVDTTSKTSAIRVLDLGACSVCQKVSYKNMFTNFKKLFIRCKNETCHAPLVLPVYFNTNSKGFGVCLYCGLLHCLELVGHKHIVYDIDYYNKTHVEPFPFIYL